MAQAATAIAQREEEAPVVTVAVAHKALDEARVRERAATLTWEKEKTNAHHLEQQLATAHGIVIPQDDDDDRSVDAGSNPDTVLVAHLHAQAINI
jgi:hypothetical protein